MIYYSICGDLLNAIDLFQKNRFFATIILPFKQKKE